jgi:tryptophan synthase alpha chain
MTEISQTFMELREKNEGALIPYLTVGDPNLRRTPRLVGALIEGGADIIELGVPFSDPIADGPTIQNAVSRSLASGTKPLDALGIAKDIRESYNVPIVLMSYFNPIFKLGLSKFANQARRARVSGIIIPDLPIEESAEYKRIFSDAGIDTIFLASPSTEPRRLKEILSQTSGYLYLISLYGVTGTRVSISESALTLVRRYHDLIAGSIPLAAGFGISKPEHIKQMIRAGADGVIVGSAFVKVVEENSANIVHASQKLGALARRMKKATRRSG